MQRVKYYSNNNSNNNSNNMGLARYIGSSKFFEMPIYLASYKATGVFRDYEWCFVGATGELYLSLT